MPPTVNAAPVSTSPSVAGDERHSCANSIATPTAAMAEPSTKARVIGWPQEDASEHCIRNDEQREHHRDQPRRDEPFRIVDEGEVERELEQSQQHGPAPAAGRDTQALAAQRASANMPSAATMKR